MKTEYMRTTTAADRQVAKRIPHALWEAFMLPGGEIFIDKRRAVRKDGSRGQRIKGGMLTPCVIGGKQCVQASFAGKTEVINVELLHKKMFPHISFQTMKERHPCHEQRAGFVIPRTVNIVKSPNTGQKVHKRTASFQRPTSMYNSLHEEMEGVNSTIPKGKSRDAK